MMIPKNVIPSDMTPLMLYLKYIFMVSKIFMDRKLSQLTSTGA